MPRRSDYYSYYPDFEPTSPIETDKGIKASNKHGAFGKNWWARRWVLALERLVDAGRLTRGRSYARRGQVLSIEETKDGIVAKVQGSRPKPYKVSIQITPLTEMQWEKVIDTLADQALFTAQLLAGEMPQDIETAFEAAGTSLFPNQRADLSTDCSCPDYANPCKHVAAAHYILGERFDEDPFLLFRLRGKNQDQILQALRQRRASQDIQDEAKAEEAEISTPLEDNLDHFWELGESLDQFSVAIRHSALEMPLLKRLGEAAFIPEPGLLFLLRPAYQTISQAALETALGEESELGASVVTQ